MRLGGLKPALGCERDKPTQLFDHSQKVIERLARR
jgi:hypothetical protein